ncbi:MAG: amidohydrolase family protein, partial [Oricola sp.]|nr:amidohydrolase family protein [Oricola sp.]
AAMIHSYERSDERGSLQIEPEVLAEAVKELTAKGIQPHVHAIGDRATRIGLDAFEQAKLQNGSALRPLISHLNVIDPEDQPRFGDLGAIAVFQPTWSSNYPYMDLTKQAIGQERSNYIYPAKGVLNGGGMLAYGADWPVATPDPLWGLQVAVTRVNYQEPDTTPLLPEEAVTLEEAVRAHTLDVAYANRMEDVTGSISPGKYADIIVLDEDIFSVPATEIGRADVILTLFEGEAVYGTLEQF